MECKAIPMPKRVVYCTCTYLPSSKGGVTPAYIRFMVGEVHPFGPAALPVAMIINTAALPLIAKFEGRYSGYH